MFKKFILGLTLSLFATVACAQTCPTRPTSDSSNSCASTAFVKNVIPLNAITGLTGDVVATGPGSVPTTVTATNCSLAASVSGNALTIALKTQSGSDPSVASPCSISFRSATASTGTSTSVAVTAALSFSTGASGSTFGSTNNVPFRLWITAWNNAGTLVLGVSNQSNATTVFPINEGAVASSTACSACTNASAAGTYYTNAAQTSKAIRILGYMDWSAGLITAGTWATGPTTIQNFGSGIKKPGDVVQTITATQTGQTTTAAGSAAAASATALTATITPTNTINLISADARGVGIGAAAQTLLAQISRGSAPTYFGSSAASGSTVTSSMSMFGIDRPGSTSAVVYTVYIWLTAAAGTGTWLPTALAPTGIIILNEIMG